MTKQAAKIRCRARLSARGMTTVEGTINGGPFIATLQPDGQKSHWLKVARKLAKSAGLDAGDVVALEIAPTSKEPEPALPANLRNTFAAAPQAKAADTV
jgi:hypothetical protein